jgi:hypothetical protein
MVKKLATLFVFFYSILFAQAVGPRVTVPQVDFSFSNIAKGSTVFHTFILYNGGGSALTLKNVKTSCRCVKASLDKSIVQPADSAKLSVEYTNTGNSNHVNNYVSISTNDPANPNLRIFVTKTIRRSGPTLTYMPKDSLADSVKGPRISFEETEYNFGKIKQDTIVSHIFKFVNKGDTVLHIRHITTSCGCTVAALKTKDIAPGKEADLDVKFDSSGKIGKLVRSITVLSNDPKEAYKTIHIYADVINK